MSKQLLKESLLLIDDNKDCLDTNKQQKTKQSNQISTNKWNQKKEKKVFNKNRKSVIAKSVKTRDKKKKSETNKCEDKSLKNMKIYKALNRNKLSHGLVKHILVNDGDDKMKITKDTGSVFTEKDFRDFALTYK